MSTLIRTLNDRLAQSRGFIREHGWTRNTLGDELNGYCMYGAICRTGLDGLHVVLRRLAMAKAHASDLETFNDTIVLNKYQAMQSLDFDITPAALEAVYGPHYEAVVGLIRQVAHLTYEQTAALELGADREAHMMQYKALLMAQAYSGTRPYVDAVLDDVHRAVPVINVVGCWAILDQVAVTQLAFDALHRGQLAITIDDLAPANVAFANLIGVT